MHCLHRTARCRRASTDDKCGTADDARSGIVHRDGEVPCRLNRPGARVEDQGLRGRRLLRIEAADHDHFPFSDAATTRDNAAGSRTAMTVAVNAG